MTSMNSVLLICVLGVLALVAGCGGDDGAERDALVTLLDAGEYEQVLERAAELRAQGLIAALPVRDCVAGVSVGLYRGTAVLDLDYAEDSDCDCDMNVVMTGAGRFIELQGTAEGEPFARAQVDELMLLAEKGIQALVAAQRSALGL